MSAVSSWGVFVSHGDVRRMAWVARVCVAIPNFAGLLTALFFGFILSMATGHGILEEVTGTGLDRVLDQETIRHQYRIMNDGHLVRFTYRELPTDVLYDRLYTHVIEIVDLDASQANQQKSALDASLLEFPAYDEQSPRIQVTLVANDALLNPYFDSLTGKANTLLIPIRDDEYSLDWWYSSTRGVILGYSTPIIVSYD
jgi:hypothetical protein